MKDILNGPLVSVMIPVYNGEKEITISLQSLFNQTYTNWECIIVDDGSTDGTLEVIRSLSDKRIRIFSFEKNKGRPYARQKALDEANGKYIAMLDADDWYYSEKLALQVDYLESNADCVLISSGMAITGKGGELDVIQGAGSGKIETYHYTHPINYKPVPHGPSMMKSINAKNIKYDLNLALGQDQDFMIRLLKNQKYAMLREVLYVYNLGDSLTLKKYIQGQNSTILMWSKQLQGHQNAINFFKKKTIAYLKIIFAIILHFFGAFEYLASRRGSPPNEAQILTFKRNKSNLRQPKY